MDILVLSLLLLIIIISALIYYELKKKKHSRKIKEKSKPETAARHLSLISLITDIIPLFLIILIILITLFLVTSVDDFFVASGIILIVLGISLAIILQGLRKIPTTKVALILFKEERIPKVKKEGWRFFLGYPHIFNYILISLVRRSPDFTPKDIRTPDNAEIKITISITWHPNSDNADDMITFINNNEIEGTEDILGDVVGERVRQWARSNKEGPKTWEEAQASGGEAVEAVLETILARNVTEAELKECLRGNGNFRMPSLGIIIDRLNIGNIEVTGAVKEAAEKKAKEIQEREAEKIENGGFRERIKENMDMGMSLDQAIEMMQTNTLKVSKTINENKLTISPETRDMIRDILGPSAVAKIIGGLLKSGKEKSEEKGGGKI
jgi:regulator of protease activity HflC (stomatin/prohibitin superfamily)